jgi:hypothetical protein
MNIPELQNKLIAVARATPPDDRVPYAFEQRILNLIQAQPVSDLRALWAGALWRAAAACLALALLLTGLSLFAPEASPPASSDLSQDFEDTLLAAVDQEQTLDSTW